MANPYAKPILDLTFTANEDLSSAQFLFVSLTSTGNVELCDAATDIPIGILQNKPKSGQQANVRVLGVSKLSISGSSALSPGTLIATHSNGRGITAPANSYVVGQVIEANAAAPNAPATVSVNCLNPTIR